jgi:DNA polymerase
MLVGEQPGNDEDLEGLPFVGPAGKLLDRGLTAAGIARADAYVTNVVKHFKWEQKGKRRLHSKPNAREIGACLPWLEAELDLVKPRVLLCLGATAAQALLGRDFRVSRDRGVLARSRWAALTGATVHPSSILRARTDEERHAAMEGFVTDLRVVARALASKAA